MGIDSKENVGLCKLGYSPKKHYLLGVELDQATYDMRSSRLLNRKPAPRAQCSGRLATRSGPVSGHTAIRGLLPELEIWDESVVIYNKV